MQAFSVYVDTLGVCTATGIMLLLTGQYNVADGKGGTDTEQAAVTVVANSGAPVFAALLGLRDRGE